MGLVKRTHTGKIICFEQTPPNLNTVWGGPTDRVFEGSKTIYMAGCSGNNLRVPLRQANPTGHRSMCMLPIFSLEYISMFNVYFHYDFPAS